MGGILDHDAWRRSNGGLWLPRVFGTPETSFGWCCCEGCACTCSLSEDGCAPCCFQVTIAGMADDANCLLCKNLNKTYYLKQTATGSSVWKCTHLCPGLTGWNCTDKGATWEITLTVTDEGDGQYKITVDLGPHKWSKNYTGKPSLATISDSLSWVSDSGSCNSSNATCSIAATSRTLDKCPCACEIVCPQCIDQLATSMVEVVIDGFANAGNCTGCPNIDGTYTLRYVKCAAWQLCCGKTPYGGGTGPIWSSGRAGNWPCPAYPCGYGGLRIEFGIARNSQTGIWYAGIRISPYSTTECTWGGDCMDNKVYSYFVKTLDHDDTDINCVSFDFSDFTACSPPDGPQACDASGATATVTAL